MAVYTKEYESQPEAILTNVIICPAVDLSANVAVPVHCQVENVLWDTGATNTLICTGSCKCFRVTTEEQGSYFECRR